MTSNQTPTKKNLSSNSKKRKIQPTTPPRIKPLSHNEISAETILRSPQKQSSQFFNINNNKQILSNKSTVDSSDSSRGRSLYESSQIKTQEVSPYRRLSPARKSPVSNNRKLSLVQLSPKKQNNTLHQLQHAMERENQNIKTGGRRLYINQLTLTNFKSYANKQIVGPFNENFTAVVGPNGSGKSNVIDSMLFVFGFRASKLRQGRLSELIHKSENYPNLEYCSVDVHFKYNYRDGFQKDDETNDELIVTRKAFKNNSSKYYVNGKESSYTQVTELLKTEGIDLDHKRFLILQGEVESIAQMKPKAEKEGDDGILEYLEDIIGTSAYKPEIEACLVQLETLNEVCIEKDNRLKIVENDLKSLEPGKDKSLEYITKERQAVILNAKKINLELKEIEFQMKEITTKTGILEQEKSELKEELKNIKNDSKNFEIDFQANVTKLKEFENKVSKLDQKLEVLSQKKIAAEEKIKNHEKTQQKDQELLVKTEDNVSKTAAELIKLEEFIVKDTEDTHALTIETNVLQEDYQHKKEALKNKSFDLEKSIAEIEQELGPSQQNINSLETDITLKSQEIQLLQQRSNKSFEKSSFLENKEKELEKKVNLNIEAMNSLKFKLKEKNDSKEKLKADFVRTKKEQLLLDEEYNKNKQKYLEAKSSMSNTDTSNKIIKALSKLQEQGRISGFYGRLGDLGVIDSKYDVAISTAAPRLNDIVVETVDCAQKCIEYLRSNKLGYSRFILLEKLSNFENAMRQNFENTLPSGSHRLFDLIKASKPRFLPAFYSILRDTIVAKSLNEANKIAYGGHRRLRVVTLDGKLIDVSGTMSGGGKQKFKGLMKLINTSNSNEQSLQHFFMTQEELKTLEDSYKTSYSDYERITREVNSLQEEIDILSSQIPDLETELLSIEFDLDNFREELKNTIKQLEVAKIQINDAKVNAEAEILNLQTIIDEKKREIENLKFVILPKTKEIEELQLQIKELGGFELDKQKDLITSNEKQLHTLNTRLKKNKLLIKKKNSDKEKFAKTIETLREKLINSGKVLSEYEDEVATSDEQINEINIEKEALTQKVSVIKEENAEIENQLVNFEKKRKAISNKMSEIEHQVKTFDAEKSQLDKKSNLTRTELQALKIRDVYEALEVLSCLPTKEIKVDESYSALQEENEDSNKMDVEEASAETTNEKIPMDIVAKEEPQDENVMDVEKESTKPLTKQVPLSHIEFLKIESYSLSESSVSDYLSEIAVLQEFLDSCTVNLTALDDYVTNYKSFKQKKDELTEAINNRDSVKNRCEVLKKNRYDEFMKGFNIISQSLKEMYQMITMGGNAELELVDSIDPFSEGILFSVMPPKKSWRNISNLSGGEKTLSSLALVFALHNYKPTPIYIMDEIDAALDFKNVSIVANYIKDRTKDAQFIVISLRNNMFELAERLVGIYKNENMTKSTTIENFDFFS